MQLSFTAHYSPSILLNQIIPVKKPQTIVLNTLNWQRVEIITFGISWIELEKAWKLQRWSTKKEIFKGGGGWVRHFYVITLAMTSSSSRTSERNLPNFSEVFTKAFPQPPCFFFLNLPKRKSLTDYIQNIRSFPVSQ